MKIRTLTNRLGSSLFTTSKSSTFCNIVRFTASSKNMTIESTKPISSWSVQSVLGSLPTPPQSTSSSPIAFLHIIERLKTTPREGWRRFSINGESIADHMYRMSIITMLCPDPSINKDRCVKMALVHDMAEAIVGDITPLDNIPKDEKHHRELTSIKYMTQDLIAPISQSIADEFLNLWLEYEEGKTLEAIFVKDVDRFELVMQTIEYEKTHKQDLGEFLHVAKGAKTPYVKQWIEDALKERLPQGTFIHHDPIP